MFWYTLCWTAGLAANMWMTNSMEALRVPNPPPMRELMWATISSSVSPRRYHLPSSALSRYVPSSRWCNRFRSDGSTPSTANCLPREITKQKIIICSDVCCIDFPRVFFQQCYMHLIRKIIRTKHIFHIIKHLLFNKNAKVKWWKYYQNFYLELKVFWLSSVHVNINIYLLVLFPPWCIFWFLSCAAHAAWHAPCRMASVKGSNSQTPLKVKGKEERVNSVKSL